MTNPELTRRQFMETLAGAVLLPTARKLGKVLEAFSFSGEHPLTTKEERRLYQTSLTYLAPTMEAAIQIAKQINFIPKNENEDPSNMCGPLAIDQLVKAGLLPSSTRVSDFWLLDPRVNENVLRATFPGDKYSKFKTETALADYDFKNDSLYPGDFVYTFGGSFEHMLTVNRVDEQGRVFAVTNLLIGGQYNGRKEFVIKEVMLYDPNDRSAGQFFDWKYGKDRSKLGTTGPAGFARWRRKLTGLVGSTEMAGSEFSTALKSLLDRSQGEWHVNIRDISGVGDRDIYNQGENDRIHPASVIKVAIGMVFFDWLARQGISDINSFLKKGPGSGRSYEQLLKAMLVDSEEAATGTLTDLLEKKIKGGTAAVLSGWGFDETTVVPRRTTAHEMMVFWEALYRGKLVSPEAREKLLAWLGQYTDGDKTRLGIIKNKLQLPAGWKINFWNKRGSIKEEMVVVADAAVIEFSLSGGAKKTYVVEFFGYPGDGAIYESLEKTIESAAELFTQAVTAGKI